MSDTNTAENLPAFLNLPLLLTPNVNDNSDSDTDINGNEILPAVPINDERRNEDAPRRMSSLSKILLTIFFCLFELITSALYVWLYFGSTDPSLPKTFAWKQIQTSFYFYINNSTDDCRHIRKPIPVKKETDIRPFLHSNDSCVIDKQLKICPYEEVTKYWYNNFVAPVFPFITFALPIVMTIMIVVHVISRYRHHNREDSTGKLSVAIYIISLINLFICIFLWLFVQSLLFVSGDSIKIKDDMMYGYDLMNSTSLSHQWELTQSTDHCCGFNSYRDWNVTDHGGLYPHSCCNTRDYSCNEAPTSDQVWHQGCFNEEKNRFYYTFGMFLLVILCKTIFELCAMCLLVDHKSQVCCEQTRISYSLIRLQNSEYWRMRGRNY